MEESGGGLLPWKLIKLTSSVGQIYTGSVNDTGGFPTQHTLEIIVKSLKTKIKPPNLHFQAKHQN